MTHMHPVVVIFLLHLVTFGVALKFGKTCNIVDYGAKGDHQTDNTKFIQSAIDDCATSKNMSLVLLPFVSNDSNKESIYMSGALFLRSNLAFYIEENVRLLGLGPYTNNLNVSYPFIYTRREGTMMMTRSSLLNGGLCLNINYNSSAIGDQCTKWDKLENIQIYGQGIIDGNGHSGWYNQRFSDTRPCLLNLMWIDQLIITNITLVDPPFWTLHIIFSQNIFIDNITITNDSPNGDGIDPDSCSNVWIQNSYISCGDDQIAIKSGKDADGRAVGIPSNNVTIINCVFGNGNGLSIGSEMSGNVTNVLFENILVNGKQKQGPHLKSNSNRGGMVANVMYKNITITNIYSTGILIDASGGNGNYYPIYVNISIVNVTISVERNAVDGKFNCFQETPCHHILLDNVDVSGGSTFQCNNAYGQAINVEPKSCLTPEQLM